MEACTSIRASARYRYFPSLGLFVALGAMTLFFFTFFFRCSRAPRRPHGGPGAGEGRCDAPGRRRSRARARATAACRARAGPRGALRRSARVRGRPRARARPGRVPGWALDPARPAAQKKKKVKKKGYIARGVKINPDLLYHSS